MNRWIASEERGRRIAVRMACHGHTSTCDECPAIAYNPNCAVSREAYTERNFPALHQMETEAEKQGTIDHEALNGVIA
tara:strand:+ start:267 stop:500 length:234 start_codon:yes stop_codon:yes gene_type:complete